MAVMQLKSSNPKFSYVIRKNPESTMLVKSLRKGHLLGWYSDVSSYNIFFKDAPNEVSYKSHPDESFEYINTTRYNSAMFVINSLSTFFQTNLKEEVDEDPNDSYFNSVQIGMMYIQSSHYLKIFDTHFKDFVISYEDLGYRNYKIDIKTKKSFHQLVNFTNLFVIFNALRNNDFLVLDEGIIQKYLSSLEVIDAPYFIRYIFKINFLTNHKKFEKFKNIIENSSSEKIEFVLGNTLDMRKRFIKNNLTFSKPIVDLGCGEGNYVTFMAKNTLPFCYHAIDRDEECLSRVKSKVARKNLENVETYSSFEAFTKKAKKNEEYEIILTEVIEHSPVEEATKLTQKVLNYEGTSRLLITTPNRDFNQFFLFEDGQFRHDDHDFEFTEQEFKDWILKDVKIDMNRFDVQFKNCGDKVNNIPVTLVAIVERI